MANLFSQKPPRKCWLIGHRGALGHAPENTMAAFKAGFKMGADFLECDVHLSRDGKCIVMHDEGVERTTNGRGLIKELLSSAIKKLDAGSWFSSAFKNERVPALRELLLWARGKTTAQGLPLGLIIEIKNEPVRYLGIEKKVLSEVKKCGMENRSVIISFDHGAVKRLKILDKNVFSGILYARPPAHVFARAAQVKADAVFPRRHLITRALAAQAKKHGKLVATWTVDDPSEMKKILKCGVHAIATNYPDKLNKLLDGPKA